MEQFVSVLLAEVSSLSLSVSPQPAPRPGLIPAVINQAAVGLWFDSQSPQLCVSVAERDEASHSRAGLQSSAAS